MPTGGGYELAVVGPASGSIMSALPGSILLLALIKILYMKAATVWKWSQHEWLTAAGSDLPWWSTGYCTTRVEGPAPSWLGVLHANSFGSGSQPQHAVASSVYVPTSVHGTKRCVSGVSRSNVSGIDNTHISVEAFHVLEASLMPLMPTRRWNVEHSLPPAAADSIYICQVDIIVGSSWQGDIHV